MTERHTEDNVTNILRNGRLANGNSVDIHVDDGHISKISPSDPMDDTHGSTACNLDGWLVLPAMAEPHAHLDKALTSEMVPNPTGDLMGAITAWSEASAKGLFTHEGTVERSAAAMELLLVHGVTAVRTHINVLGDNQTKSLRAVKEAAERFTGLLDVQTVALTSRPMTGPDGALNRAALEAAIEEGVDFVGGCPHLDPDAPAMISHALAVAADAGIGIDLHVDEMLDPSILTLRELAQQVIATGFDGLVAASHCVTLGMQSKSTQLEVSKLVAEAGIAVFPLPQTNLFLQGRDDPTATPRGLTAVKALQDSGVLVAAGADNVQDPFNLVGRSDPLETAALMVMAGHQLPETAYEMVSNNVRRAIGMPEVNIEVGDPADLMAINAPSVRGAIADAPMSRRVFRGGILVASTDQQTAIYRH
ncbi:MAG: amidohydrolase family protein [Acidimicrobiales bacterium]